MMDIVSFCLKFGFILLCCLKLIEATDYSFHYPCYVDVCTYPQQYCDSARSERKCNKCLLWFCGTTEMPPACKYFCDEVSRSTEDEVQRNGDASSGSGRGTNLWFISTIILSITCVGLMIYGLAKTEKGCQMTQHIKRTLPCRRHRQNNPVRATSETDLKTALVIKDREGTSINSELVPSNA